MTMVGNAHGVEVLAATEHAGEMYNTTTEAPVPRSGASIHSSVGC
jgi:hypothetical protein